MVSNLAYHNIRTSSKSKGDKMGSSQVKNLEGFAARGGDMPWLNPHAIRIVGLDVPETADNWFAYCARADEVLENEWVDDIRQNGVRIPVDVFTDGDCAVLLEGRRRVRAARIVWEEQEKNEVSEADRIKVRVSIRKGSPLALLAFNAGSDIKKFRTPLQRALLMSTAQKYGATNEDLARAFSCTTQTVKNTLCLLDLAPVVQDAIEQGQIAATVATQLSKMPRAVQREALAGLLTAGATKGAAAKNGVDKVKRGEKVGEKDKTRTKSRAFLEKWRDVLKADGGFDYTVDVIDFVLGRKPSDEWERDFAESLCLAGWSRKSDKKVPKPKKAKQQTKTVRSEGSEEPEEPEEPDTLIAAVGN